MSAPAKLESNALGLTESSIMGVAGTAPVYSIAATTAALIAAVAVAGLVMLLFASRYPSINQVIQDSVNAVGIQAAFYYGLACLACAWHVWRSGERGPRKLLLLVLWPLLSAAFRGFIALYGIPTFDVTANVVGLGGIAIGLAPMWLNRNRSALPAEPRVS